MAGEEPQPQPDQTPAGQATSAMGRAVVLGAAMIAAVLFVPADPTAPPSEEEAIAAANLAVGQAAVMQEQTDTFLMQQRMNNYMAGGGNMGDPDMTKAMQGQPY